MNIPLPRMPLTQNHRPQHVDQDVKNAWTWFISFLSTKEWAKRKSDIEEKISVQFIANDPVASKRLPQAIFVKEDMISWYLYLVEMILIEPHKYEYFQGARVVPIFQSFGRDLEKLKKISGIEKKVKQLLWKRKSEADAFLFEFLVSLQWVRNGYEVELIDEVPGKKSPDILAKKNGEQFFIECKRQSKTADYTYRETAKRNKMLSLINDQLIEMNALLSITFHVEVVSLPDTFLKGLLERISCRLQLKDTLYQMPKLIFIWILWMSTQLTPT